MVLILNSWILARGSPVAILQHPTSSQSIIFEPHQAVLAASSITTTPAPVSSISQSKYEYKYEVSDHRTGDRKSHWERRDGDNVRGVYTLYEPDGAIRTVEYTADAKHGFNAVVKRNDPNKHQQPPRNEGYNYKIPLNGDFDERSQGNQLQRDIFTNKGVSKHIRKETSSNPSVEFTVVHERNF